VADQVDAETEAEVEEVDADVPAECDDEYWDEAPAVAQWWGVAAFVLSLLGFGDALYLTIEHFNGAVPICSASGVVDCAKVTTSAQSYFLHIPVALLGLLFFTSMLVINVPPLWRTRHAWVAWLRLAMASVGLVSVIYLVSAEVFTIKAICLWCTGVHVISVALFVLVLATFPAVLQAARAGDGADGDEA
jgi:uncharacterized membrane protein